MRMLKAICRELQALMSSDSFPIRRFSDRVSCEVMTSSF